METINKGVNYDHLIPILLRSANLGHCWLFMTTFDHLRTTICSMGWFMYFKNQAADYDSMIPILLVFADFGHFWQFLITFWQFLVTTNLFGFIILVDLCIFRLGSSINITWYKYYRYGPILVIFDHLWPLEADFWSLPTT